MMHRPHRRIPLWMGLAAVTLLAGTMPPPAYADLVRRTPSIVVTIPRVTTQAQLAQQLEAQGYTNVKLSSVKPNFSDPRPELSKGLSDEPRLTPVHEGWNGTADKDGRTVDVRVTYGMANQVTELPH